MQPASAASGAPEVPPGNEAGQCNAWLHAKLQQTHVLICQCKADVDAVDTSTFEYEESFLAEAAVLRDLALSLTSSLTHLLKQISNIRADLAEEAQTWHTCTLGRSSTWRI